MCARCRAVHATLTAARDERTDDLPVLDRPPLAFLASSPKDAGWSSHVRARVGGKPLGFGFRVQPKFLRHLLTIPSLAPVRGASAADDGTLILSDTVTLGLNDVLVEVWLRPLAKPNHARLDISVTSTEPLPAPLRVTIRWKGARYTKTLTRGQTSIAPVSLSALKHATSLRVDFEAGAIGATIEEYRELG
ncbi:MAG: hypothetical protein HZC40_18775 [Chloroflexi bacterium]|nr:hypothetical protein [Chloroflexota bacterium]